MARRQDGDGESRRILRRIAQESDPGGSLAVRMANRARDHLAAADVDPSDRIEQLGTRIGRVLAAAITVAVLAGFVLFLMQRG
jgi:hypothetical protein